VTKTTRWPDNGVTPQMNQRIIRVFNHYC